MGEILLVCEYRVCSISVEPSKSHVGIYNQPILQKYTRTESYTPIHTGGGMIESHFWMEIPLKLDNQVIQIKTLVCDSECPNDIGATFHMARLYF